MELSVSLVVYHQRLEQVRALLDAVLCAQPKQFVIVDNGQDAFFCHALQQKFPQICYLPSDNRGFGAGHNQAIRLAMKTGAKYLAVVNPDIEFEPGTLEAIAGYLDAHPDVGMLMPKTLNADGSLQYNCKLVPSPFDLIFKRFLPKWMTRRRMERFMLKGADFDKEMDIPYLCGCFLVFRLEALREIGLFDERFFMYPEDIDITRRMYASRWRSVYWPGAAVTHAHEAASYKNWRMLRIHIWNMIKYFNKWGWLFDFERYRINREVRQTIFGFRR